MLRQVTAIVRRLFEPPVERVPRWWLYCPVCDAELVGPYPAGTIVARSPGPSRLDPSHAELVAKCPVHGTSPYNDAPKKPPVRRAPIER